MFLKKFLRWLKGDAVYDLPPTFQEELNRQCGALTVPASIIAIFSWLLYIQLDKNLYTELPILIYLRLGFCLLGLVTLGLFFTPYFRNKGYLLLFTLAAYLSYATAVILGLVAGDPVYMGGISIVVLILALLPLQRKHAILLLYSSLLIFFIVGTINNMTFKISWELYGLYNLLVAASVSTIGILVFDRIRKTSYQNHHLVKDTNEELKKANKIKSELLEIAAHDLKDPLQVIIGYTDLLQMKLKDDSFAIDKLSKIYKSTDQMIKLITGVLEFASIESGKLLLNHTQVNFPEMARTVVSHNQPNAEKKNQEIVLNLIDNCTVSGDRILLQQVVENFVGNAVKFSPLGATILVNVFIRDDFGVISVRDEGPGISKAEIENKLFKKFQRLSARPTGDESSTGLGLALCKELVKLHDGIIRVESQLGKGSEFFMEIPRGIVENPIQKEYNN